MLSGSGADLCTSWLVCCVVGIVLHLSDESDFPLAASGFTQTPECTGIYVCMDLVDIIVCS